MKGRTILSVRKHLAEYNKKIHLDTTYVQHPLRENDVSIMELVNTQTNHKMNTNQKEKINCVRMFLGVQYVRKISTVDGTSFVPGILEGDDSQLCYQITLTKPHQEHTGDSSWRHWKRILKTLTPSPKTTTNKLTKRLGKWINAHSECGKWLSYHDRNENFYAKKTHIDKEWIVYKRTNKGTQLICIDTIKEYQPTKYSTSVQIHTAAKGTIYRELGAVLKIDKKLKVCSAESF